MIRAAVDLRTNYPALVVADDETRQIYFAGSIELGTLTSDKKKRTFTPGDVQLCAQAILDKACMADRIVVVGDVQGLGVRLSETCTVDFDTIKVKPAKISTVKHLEGWPTCDRTTPDYNGWSTGNYAGTRAAAHILLTDLGLAEAPTKGKSPKTLRENDRSKPVGTLMEGVESPSSEGVRADTQNEARPTHLAGRPTLDVDPSTDLQDSAPSIGVSPEEPTPTDLPGQEIVAGFDTGANVGIVIAEKLGPFWRQLFRETVAVDASDPEVRADFARGIAHRLHVHGVTRVVIERVTTVHGADDGDGAVFAVRAMATRLVAANWLGGMVEAICLTAPTPPEVETAPAAHWRRSLLGGKVTPGDDEVRTAVEGAFPVWPAGSSSHERDAAGLILWDAKRSEPEAVKPARPPRKGTAKRKEGCTCTPGRKGAHLKGCPARVPRGKGTVQLCKACGEPRRGHVCPVEVARNTDENKSTESA